jgi:hypothetical protein
MASPVLPWQSESFCSDATPTLVVSGAKARRMGWRKHTQDGTTTEFAPLRVSSLEFGGAIQIE